MPANAETTGGHVCTENGNHYCIGDLNGINVGDNVTDQTLANARDITAYDIDSQCGPQPCERQYLKFNNGDYVASVDSCTVGAHIVVKGPNETTGIVWVSEYDTQDNTTVFVNQHCAELMYSPNTAGGDWREDTEQRPGEYFTIQGIF
jgi:hypothetical protein